MTFQDAGKKSDEVAEGLDWLAMVMANELTLTDEAQKLQVKAQQIRDDRFRVLVVGEFKRGKSTLLNAMIGDDVLPRKVTPCTAVVTLIQYGDEPSVKVSFVDERPSETLSPATFKTKYELTVDDATDSKLDMDRFAHVDHAVISYPIELCRHRVELVDSPGLGEHGTRTRRTQKFLPQADAVVIVLNATQFLSEEEVHFLENVLLPLGLRNIFFVVNGWNLIDVSAVSRKEAEGARAELEQRIQQRLTPFCVFNGRDLSAERIFRVNAFGALKARMPDDSADESPDEVEDRKAGARLELKKSKIPEFEKSLQKFLLEDRARARGDVVRGVIDVAVAEVERFVGNQIALADKSLAQIESERASLEPKLERLRGIRQNIASFLQAKSAVLQDSLVQSLQDHVRKIEVELPDDVRRFDLSPVTNGIVMLKAVTGYFAAEEDKLERRIENCVKPQVQKLLERRFAEWEQSVLQNEMQAATIDVESHLQEEAKEYQRVMREIEDQIGFHSNPLQIQEQVARWLGRDYAGPGKIQLAINSALGEFAGWITVGIVAEVFAEAVMHVATGGVTLIISGVMALVRAGWREARIRTDIDAAVVAGVVDGLRDMGVKQAAGLRAKVRAGFDGLVQRIGGSIDEEIAVIDASLTGIVERKREHSYNAEAERKRLELARNEVSTVAAKMHTVLDGI